MFTEEELRSVEEITSRYPTEQAAVMPVLFLYQEKYGYVSLEGIAYVASLLHLPPEHVLGIVSFYEMYHDHPVGRHNLLVCTNVSCLLRGSDGILAAIREKLGVGPGETTADGLSTVHEAECLGSCGTAPMMAVGTDYKENLTPESAAAIIDALRNTPTDGRQAR